MQADPEQYKDVMARWSTGVTVATTVGPGGVWHGITATSFASVSLEPPLVLICVGRILGFRAAIEESGVFAINILASDQVYRGLVFAGLVPEITDRFAGLACTTALTGSPLLPETVGWLDCRLWNSYDGGDHVIFVGKVLTGGRSSDRAPLLYSDRQWGSFVPAPAHFNPPR